MEDEQQVLYVAPEPPVKENKKRQTVLETSTKKTHKDQERAISRIKSFSTLEATEGLKGSNTTASLCGLHILALSLVMKVLVLFENKMKGCVGAMHVHASLFPPEITVRSNPKLIQC